MIKNYVRIVGLYLVFLLLAVPSVSTADEPGALLPSEALEIMLNEFDLDADKSRKDVYSKYLPRIIKTDLERDELLLLGDVYYFCLMPEEARDAYYEFRDGSDMHARVAWERLLNIRFRAFSMVDRVAREIVDVRKKFDPDPRDRMYFSRQTRNLAQHYQDAGEHEKVLAVVADELKQLDYSGPYDSYMLPAMFAVSYIALEKESQAVALLQNAVEGLGKTLAERHQNTPENDLSYPVPGDRTAFLYHPLILKVGYQQQNDYFSDLIAKLQAALDRFVAY